MTTDQTIASLKRTIDTLAEKLAAVERERDGLRDERERVLAVLRPACHSGVNLGEHTAVYRALVEMGER